jgi:hypothetical protein
MRPYINYTDDEIVEAITETYAARRKINSGGIAVVVAGEGRRVEYSRGNTTALAEDLRMLEYEARLRRLEIAGDNGAIAVEFR